MAIDLSSDEIDVLAKLATRYPIPTHFLDLAREFPEEKSRQALLLAVDGLLHRKLVEAVPLRSGEGLIDAAKILLSSAGASYSKSANSGLDSAPTTGATTRATPPTNELHSALVINVVLASPSDTKEECQAVIDAIRSWNASNYYDNGYILNPIRLGNSFLSRIWVSSTRNIESTGNRPRGCPNRHICVQARYANRRCAIRNN